MTECKACKEWFSAATERELCPTCERALKRLQGYVKPVVKGQWIWLCPTNHKDRPYCSECLNDTFFVDGYGFTTENFCPFCGADMRQQDDPGAYLYVQLEEGVA